MAKIGEIQKGDTVMCPPDMAQPAFKAIAEIVGTKTYKRSDTIPYVYISVKDLNSGRRSTWSSNRLTKI